MEFIKKIFFEANIMDQKVLNPKTGVQIKVADALHYPDTHPVKQNAMALIQADKEENKKTKKINKVKQDQTLPIQTEPIELQKKLAVAPIEKKPERKVIRPQAPADSDTSTAVTSKKNERSHKPKSKSYGISKEAVEWLKAKGLTGLNVYPQSFVTLDQIELNPEIKTKGKDAVWVAKFPVILPNGKQSYKVAYTREFMKKSQMLKYKKISKIKETDLTSLDEKTHKLLKNANPIISDAACVIAIILKTGLRVGSRDSDVEDGTGNLGVRTLKKENITVEGDKISLKFIGKSYQENIGVFNSKPIADYLSKKLSSKKDQDDVFACSYAQVNSLMEHINPKGITPKDLRTYKATEFAKKLLESKELGPPPPLPENEKSIKSEVKEKLKKVFTAVSQLLNNSPTMAKNSYVHPAVITSWLHSLGLKPENVAYKHITLENKMKKSSTQPKFLSMDQMLEQYKNEFSESDDLMEDIQNDLQGISPDNNEYENCEEYEIPEWFFDPNIDLVKI